LARLDGAADTLPNPDLFVYMYVRKEAVLSSQIEGTQASLDDLLEYEAQPLKSASVPDVQEVANYVAAMNHGLQRLGTLPVSLRLIREIHGKLLADVRGSERSPGEFRRSQNWIGPSGCTLNNARYVPPPVHEMTPALDNLEKFCHIRGTMPDLIQLGLIHAQFETIHPFLDGNGRVGRLLVTLLLCERGILTKPLLYLSIFFKRRRDEYYSRLQAVRDEGRWEDWLRFFLEGVADVALDATNTARRVLKLRDEHRDLIHNEGRRRTANALRLLDAIFLEPYIDVNHACKICDLSYSNANELVSDLCKLGILQEITGRVRNRMFRYHAYLDLFTESDERLDNSGKRA
jgi:Fic family protein